MVDKTEVKLISSNYRGLFALKNIASCEIIERYVGTILSEMQFKLKYPLQDIGKTVIIDKKFLKFLDTEGNVEISTSEHTDPVLQSYDGNHAVVSSILDQEYQVVPNGYHLANHTLQLISASNNNSIYIDSEDDDDTIIGKAAYANSADLDNINQQRKNNATFYYSYKSRVAFLVATRDISKGDEILAAYNQEEMKRFSTLRSLLANCTQ